MAYTTVLLQAIKELEGEGLNSPQPLNLSYTVPQGCSAGIQYVRVGSTVTGMTNVTILKNRKVMRYVPVASGDVTHVPLAIVDDLQTGVEIEVVAAAEDFGTLILDVGILEVNTA